MEEIMKIIKSLEESGLLIKGISTKIKNETKEQVGIHIGIASSVIGLKVCIITAEIKKYESIVKKKKKKHDKIILLANSKLNSIEVLISKASINSSISREQFF